MDDDTFDEIEASELKFDGIDIYHPANLCNPEVNKYYKGWKKWANGQVKRLAFF